MELALLIGDGCAAYLSICQGMKNEERAHKCVGNTVVMSTAAGLLLTAAFLFLKEPMLAWFGATENNIAYAEEYFEYLVIGIPFFLFANAMNSIIRADGSPQFAMLSTLAGCIINVVLDPIAIFVLHWGMMGAAVATVAGQAVSALLAVCYLLHTKSFRVFLGMIVLCCLQKAASIFQQSLGKPLLSMSLSLLREFVLSVPLALILPGLFGVTGALYSAPAADIVSFAAAVLCMVHVFREMKTEEKKLEEPLKTSVCLSILE